MKNWLLSLVFLPVLVLAETPTLCEEQTQTIFSVDKDGREIVKTVTEKICVDNSHQLKRSGLANGICGVPRHYNPNTHYTTITCLRPDRRWEQIDVNPLVDKTMVSSNQDIPLPDFFDPGRGDNASIVFGWLTTKKLSGSALAAHEEAIWTALTSAGNGQRVIWKLGNDQGFVMPVATFPSSQGYCRRIHGSVTYSNKNSSIARTACYDNSSKLWKWISDK